MTVPSRQRRVDALAAFSALRRVGVKGGFIAVNPCGGVDLPRDAKADPAARALSLEEIGRLLAILPESDPYRRFVLAMLYTGCRLGEVAGLRVSDVELDARIIRVSRTASPGLRGELVIGPTKNRRTRAVPLSDQLAPVVAEAMKGRGPHDLMFSGPRGGIVSSKNLSRAVNWPEMRDRVKTIPPGERPLRWHDLRHTAAVIFFRAGLSAPDVQAILGHSSPVVTQLYADTRADAARRGAPALTASYRAPSIGQLGGGEG